VIFVIRGGNKWTVFDGARRGGNDLPVARLLRAAKQKVTCFT
jgi:6-phosphogluconolactonase